MYISIYDIIREYYNFYNFNIEKVDNHYIIDTNNNKYSFFRISNREMVEKIYNIVSNYNIFDTFVKINLSNEFILNYNNKEFVLIFNRNIEFTNDCFLSLFLCKTDDLISNFFSDDFISKKNMYEDLYLKNSGKYLWIDETIDYYLCIFEVSIYYLKNYNKKYVDYGYVQHLKYDNLEYSNPLNLVIDFKEKAFSRYLKYLFFTENYKKIDLYLLFFNWSYQFNNINFDLIVSYLFYPDYYFEKLIKKFDTSDDGINIENDFWLFDEYENYIINIIGIINNFSKIKIPIIGI